MTAGMDKAAVLAAALAQLPAAQSGAVNVVGMPEFDGLLGHIYEYGTAAEGVIEMANAFARAVLARYAPQQPADVDAPEIGLEAIAWAHRKPLAFGCYSSEQGAMMGDRLNLMLLAAQQQEDAK